MLNEMKTNEINAWANVLQALGQNGHEKASVNELVLREITVLVKEELENLSKK